MEEQWYEEDCEENDYDYEDDDDLTGECEICGGPDSPWNELMDDYCCWDCWETQSSSF